MLFRQCQCGGGTAGAQRVPKCCHEYFKRDRCEAGGALPRIDRTMQRSGYSFPARRGRIFHSQGIKIALDDFGTGNSSLSLALELPFDELKVDMSFIRDIKQKPQNQAMVQSIVDYAKRTNTEICIEGIENKEVSDYIEQFGSTWQQGYYYSKPVPIDRFEEVLREKSTEKE